MLRRRLWNAAHRERIPPSRRKQRLGSARGAPPAPGAAHLRRVAHETCHAEQPRAPGVASCPHRSHRSRRRPRASLVPEAAVGATYCRRIVRMLRASLRHRAYPASRDPRGKSYPAPVPSWPGGVVTSSSRPDRRGSTTHRDTRRHPLADAGFEVSAPALCVSSIETVSHRRDRVSGPASGRTPSRRGCRRGKFGITARMGVATTSGAAFGATATRARPIFRAGPATRPEALVARINDA